MSDGVKLEACPFCGGEAIRWPAGELTDEGIINELAGCYGNDPERRHPFLRMTPTAWNTRKSDDGWRTMESAPKDGTWILIRGRNAANKPMIPVVCAWRSGMGLTGDDRVTWRDSAGFRDMWALVADVPTGSSADWRPLPSPPKEGKF